MQGSVQHRTVQQVQYIAVRVVHLHDRRVFESATDKKESEALEYVLASHYMW